MRDEVEKPDHYQFGQMEAWDIIELALIGTHDPVTAYHVASALKYLLRATRKGGDTDIAKASAHLKRETARHVRASPSAAVNFGLNQGPGTAHPMAAEALRDQDEATPGCAPWRLP